MEEQGRETETQKILQNQRQQAKLELRKKNINQILMEKRMFQAHQKELSQPIEIEVPEVKEEIEVERRLGHLSLSKHCNNKKKRQKKCWNCKSTKHFKERCPYRRCFFVKKKPHQESLLLQETDGTNQMDGSTHIQDQVATIRIHQTGGQMETEM